MNIVSDDREAIRIRLASLADLPPSAEASLDWLNSSEQERLAAISAPRRRRQFLAGHWLAREIAAEYGGGDSDDWDIVSSDSGAPMLVSRDGSRGMLQLSLTHSGDRIASAVARQAIGLDLEFNPRPRDLAALAQFVFSPEENAALRALSESEFAAAFYRCWTLKEAYGKRQGTGLRIQAARQQTFSECAPEQAMALTWQSDGVTLAIVGAQGIRAHLIGWENAPEPTYWAL